MKINISKAMNKMVTKLPTNVTRPAGKACLLYTSDAADE